MHCVYQNFYKFHSFSPSGGYQNSNARVSVLCISEQPCGVATDLLQIKGFDGINNASNANAWDDNIDLYVTKQTVHTSSTQLGFYANTGFYQYTFNPMPTTPAVPVVTASISGRKVYFDSTAAVLSRSGDDLVVDVEETEVVTTRFIIEYDIDFSYPAYHLGGTDYPAASGTSYNNRIAIGKNYFGSNSQISDVYYDNGKLNFIVNYQGYYNDAYGIEHYDSQVDHFEITFHGEQTNAAVKTRETVNGVPKVISEDIAILLPTVSTNEIGAIRVDVAFENGVKIPYDRFWFQAFGIIDSPDGVGPFGGNFYKARYYGFAYPVKTNQWFFLTTTGITGGDVNVNTLPEPTKQSLRDAGLLFETEDIDNVYSFALAGTGPFYKGGVTNGNNVISLAPLGEETDDFTNGIPNPYKKSAYIRTDVLTELDKCLHPTCPKGKVLSGDGVFNYEVVSGNAIVSEPICTINDTDFHNFSGWDATTTRDEMWLVLAYNRTLTRWEFHTGYGWEVINLMSIPWDGDEWLLATISNLIDGTIASIAWKVIYDTSQTPSVPSFEIWFRRTIDGGVTWSDAVKANTVTKPFLTRVTQSPTTGIMKISEGTSDEVTSTNGGESWE